MTPEKAKQLLQKYNSGTLTATEEAQLEKCIELGFIELEELDDIRHLSKQLDRLVETELSRSMQAGFREMLAYESSRPQRSWWEKVDSFLGRLMPGAPTGNLALAGLMLVLGLALGSFFFQKAPPSGNEEIAALSGQMEEMKEMMMLTLIEKESPSDRLKAVNMTQDMAKASRKVTDALFKTLNTDDNVNVRLEALDALYHYADHPSVREGLIRSIAQQDSPMMQVALAEVMVALQEEKSVPALKELLEKEQVPDMIKEKLKEKIDVLM